MSTESVLNPQAKIALIKENLQEVLKPEILEDVIVKQDRPLKIYWGTRIPAVSNTPSPRLISHPRHGHNWAPPLRLLRPHG